jgi:acetoacetate decarboxylase
LAPVAELPVLEIVSAIHICADLTLGLGEVVHDYLRQPTREPLRFKENTRSIRSESALVKFESAG